MADVNRLVGDRSLRDGDAVLLDASAGRAASALVAAATRRVGCVAVDAGPSMLIRPDACVAWVGEQGGTDGLAQALRRWFGPARA